jgi:hypothetical protein
LLIENTLTWSSEEFKLLVVMLQNNIILNEKSSSEENFFYKLIPYSKNFSSTTVNFTYEDEDHKIVPGSFIIFYYSNYHNSYCGVSTYCLNKEGTIYNTELCTIKEYWDYTPKFFKKKYNLEYLENEIKKGYNASQYFINFIQDYLDYHGQTVQISKNLKNIVSTIKYTKNHSLQQIEENNNFVNNLPSAYNLHDLIDGQKDFKFYFKFINDELCVSIINFTSISKNYVIQYYALSDIYQLLVRRSQTKVSKNLFFDSLKIANNYFCKTKFNPMFKICLCVVFAKTNFGTIMFILL